MSSKEYRRAEFEEVVFRDYFISTITRNENPPQPKIAGALDFVSTCTMTRDQFCERSGEGYKRKDVSAMWHGWKACVSELENKSDNLQLRELLQRCHHQLHSLVCVFVSDQDGAHKETCDLMRTIRDQLGMSHQQDKP